MSLSSGLSAALSSSPGSFTMQSRGSASSVDALYAKHKKKLSVKASATQEASLQQQQGPNGGMSKSLPVNIPSAKREKRLSHGNASSGTPRSVTVVRERDEAVSFGSAKLSGLVAPVRPVSGSFEREAARKNSTTHVSGFAAPVNELTKPLTQALDASVAFHQSTNLAANANANATNTTNNNSAASSVDANSANKPSLLTMALESESDVDEHSAGTSFKSTHSHFGDGDKSGANGGVNVENPVLVSGFASRNEELAFAQEKRISADLSSRHEVFGAPLVKLAFELGRCAHMGQLRRNGEAYLSHVVETAEILARLGLDEQTVAAGLLHDILDDTMMTEQQLREYIPAEVVDMVVGVSRMSQVSQINRDLGFSAQAGETQAVEAQGDRFKNMLLSMADVRVVLIKLADRLHNMRTLNALAPEKQRKIAEETMHVFVPLANRLGVWSIKAELEDLCFKYLNQSDFLQLQNCLNDDFMKVQRINLQTNLDKLQDAMRTVGFEYKDLHGRPKNVFGIHKKMQKKGITFEEVYDLCACRCIVGTKKECYKVLDLVHSIWKPVEGKFKDYIKNPKENGYKSLHTVVVDEEGNPFEIQIRTSDMHFIAEYGLAAHWQYKESNNTKMKKNKRAEQQIAWNRWLVTWQMELQDRKYRPSGSPDNPKDVFVSFPEDEPTPPAPADMEYDPIYTLVSSNGNVSVKEVPARCSLYTLSKEILRVKPGTHFLVNNRVVDEDEELRMGDLVEIVEQDYFADEFDVEESDDEPLFELFDFERQKLEGMYQNHDRVSA